MVEITEDASRRIQSSSDKKRTNQGFKQRAQKTVQKRSNKSQ